MFASSRDFLLVLVCMQSEASQICHSSGKQGMDANHTETFLKVNCGERQADRQLRKGNANRHIELETQPLCQYTGCRSQAGIGQECPNTMATLTIRRTMNSAWLLGKLGVDQWKQVRLSRLLWQQEREVWHGVDSCIICTDPQEGDDDRFFNTIRHNSTIKSIAESC